MAALLQMLAPRFGLAELTIESAGTIDRTGAPANEHSVAVMREFGLDLSHHVSRSVESLDLSGFDLILSVDEPTRNILIKLGAEESRVVVLGAADGGIPNPYEKGPEAYRTCAATIERELEKILTHRK